MRLHHDEITTRARALAHEFSRSIDVTQVVANDGESDHVELLLTISGCHQTPCNIMVNVPRDGRTFEADLRARLREALAAHALEVTPHA